MNVVFLPALASLLGPIAVADGLLCLEGPCLLGWAWSILALTFASAWIVRHWQAGGDVAGRFVPVGASVTAPLPRPVALAPLSRRSLARPPAEFAVAGLALRAPPTTDMADAAITPPVADRAVGVSGPSLPSLRPSRSPGTPTPPAPRAGSSSGQYPPA